ncbi:MAG: hypothetical protein WCC92_22420 [Candidatus Korobacteraceae bacterium]
MTQLNHRLRRLVGWTVLVLLIACLMTEFPAAQTASPAANQRRAQLTQNSAVSTNSPNPSSLGAMSASVDAEIDRRVNADRLNELIDPSLTPLRITSPNVNGEGEASLQPQPETRLSNNDRTNNFTTVPLSTNWNPGNLGASQNMPILTAQPSEDSLEQQHHRPVRRSDMADRAHTTSSGSAPILGTATEMTQASVHRSNHTVLGKPGHQQDMYRRDCSKMDLTDSKCKANLKQHKVFTNQHEPTQLFPESLTTAR